MTSTSMSLEEKLDAILKHNQEITSSNQELKAQNEYLRKQLGSFLKQKQKVNEEAFQSDPRVREQAPSRDFGSSSEEELPRTTREPRFHDHSSEFKVELPEFEGKLNPEEFLAWLRKVERVLEFMDIPESKRVKLVALRLRKYASLWWTSLCAKRVRERKSKIRTWEKMKSKLKARFLPFNYVQDCYSQPHHLIQGSLNVEEHIREFEKLTIKSDPQEPNEQTVSKGISFHTPNPTAPPFPTPQKDLAPQKNLPSQSTPKGVLSYVECQNFDHLASESANKIITPAEWNKEIELEKKEEKEGEYVEEIKEYKLEEEELEAEFEEGEYITLNTHPPKGLNTIFFTFGEIITTPSIPPPPQTLKQNFCHFQESPMIHKPTSKGMNEEQVFKTKKDLFAWLILFQPIFDPTVKVITW